MADPTTGYNGRTLIILKDGLAIAAIQSREFKFKREGVEVTTDDSDGFQRFLSEPGKKGIDVSGEGVATVDNMNILLEMWNGTNFEDISLQFPNGTVITAGDGFLFTDLSMKGEHDKHVAFSCSFVSSGVVSIDFVGSTT